MTLANAPKPSTFLAEYWQKKSLFMPAAIGADMPLLPADELAWLAMQDDVESRLVLTDLTAGDATYEVISGPFDEATLSTLPASNWTLLVQDVEKHLPEFRQWLALIPFIPDWRVDDLMISAAAPGGSVGPHKDNYDVFLCQTHGNREWRLSTADDHQEKKSSALRLLQPFSDPEPTNAQAGDILYLPPGMPHWGIATTLCTTLSIGMRAPEREELRCTFEREYPTRANPFGDGAINGFYADPDLLETECVTGLISLRAIRRCRDLCDPDIKVNDEQLAVSLGCTATDLKAWLCPEPMTPPAAKARLKKVPAGMADIHAMARLAWSQTDNKLTVFANGHRRTVTPAELAVFRDACATRSLDIATAVSTSSKGFVLWLLQVGIFDLVES